MRRSTVYNSYLSPAMVDMIVRKFMYDFTLAEQDTCLATEDFYGDGKIIREK